MGTVRSGRRTRRVGLLAVQGATLIVAGAVSGRGDRRVHPRPHQPSRPAAVAGERSRAQLFGVFDISVVHNLVHLVFGVAGLIFGAHLRQARTYLIGGGFVFLGLWLTACSATPPTGRCPQQRRQLAAPVRRRGDDPCSA